MRPDPDLAALLGLAGPGRRSPMPTSRWTARAAPGAGIVADTIQFHGTADRYALNGATSVATLFSDATTATAAPAVTLRNVGAAGGQAAAFTYDLARSVVYTRQGNPAWAGHGARRRSARCAPTTSSSAAARTTGSTSARSHIPQADEQQRLLANLITQMTLDRTPLPRFWYLPRGAAGGRRHDRRRSRHRRDARGSSTCSRARAPAAARSPTGNASARRRTCIPSTPMPGAAGYRSQGVRARAAPRHRLREPERQRAAGASGRIRLARVQDELRHPADPDEPDPLHRVERLGRRRRSSSARRACGSTRTTTTGRARGCWASRACSRGRASRCGSRTPTDRSIDVYQATTQLTDEWGATQTAVDRRRTAHRRAARRARSGPRGTTARSPPTCTPMRRPSPSGRDGHRRVGEGARRAGGLRGADARLARRPQRLVVPGRRLQRRPAALQRRARRRRERARGDGARRRGDRRAHRADARRRPVAATTRTVKGIGYVVFPAAAGAYVATYGTGGGSPFPATPAKPASGTAGERIRGRPGKVRSARQSSCATGPASRPRGSCGSRCAARRSEKQCRVDVRLRRAGRLIAQKSLTLVGGRTTKVKLRLSRRARTQLARAGSLQVKAVLRLTNGEAAREVDDAGSSPRAPNLMRPSPEDQTCGGSQAATLSLRCIPGMERQAQQRAVVRASLRRNRLRLLVAALVVCGGLVVVAPSAQASCAAPANEIVAENCKPGKPASQWDIAGAGDASIQGFATDISVDPGQTVHFKIDTTARRYRLDIYRMGYYGGDGARKVATVNPTARCRRRSRPASTQAATGLVDCGNWAVSASWAVPADRGLGHLLRQAGARRHGRREPHRLRRPRRRRRTRTCCSRRPTRPGRPTTTYGGNSLYVGGSRRRPRLQGQLQPAVHHARQRARGLAVQRRVPDGPLAGAQRLRRQLHHRRRHRSARRRAARAQGLPVGRPRRVLVGRAARERRSGARRGRQPGVLQRQRGLLEDALGRQHRRLDAATARWSPTRRRTPTRRSTPTPTWTGTWRDPRFSPPADGGRARERAHRHDLHASTAGTRGARRARPPTASCGSGATPGRRRCAPAQIADADRRARSATSGTRTSTTASARPA